MTNALNRFPHTASLIQSLFLMDYLVEMKVVQITTLLSPAEVANFGDRVVLPTMDAFRQLRGEGKIIAGGPLTGAMAFAFIMRVDSTSELDRQLTGLPIWSRCQTNVTPLTPFEDREIAVRERLATLKARLQGEHVAVGR
jgi:muconolactone delta-isomerase